MQYLNNWQRNLSRNFSLILAALFIFLFAGYAYLLFSRLLAQNYLIRSLNCLEKARSTSKEILTEKSLLYQNGLRLLKNSLKLIPYDAKAYYEYGQVITEIGEDSELSSSLDIKSFGAKVEGKTGFYNLAKLEYTAAILKEPTNAIYHQRLGAIFEKLLDTKKAEEEFRRAVLLDGQNIRIHLFLSRYYLSQDRRPDFLYHLNRAVDLYKVSLRGGSIATTVQEFLKSIGCEDLIK